MLHEPSLSGPGIIIKRSLLSRGKYAHGEEDKLTHSLGNVKKQHRLNDGSPFEAPFKSYTVTVDRHLFVFFSLNEEP